MEAVSFAIVIAGLGAAAMPQDTHNVVSTDVESIIEVFEPPWLPPRGGLRSVAVIVNPVWRGLADPDRRQSDELSAMTAAWLHHLVSRSGGTSILSPTGGGPSPVDPTTAPFAATHDPADPRGHVFVRIDFGSTRRIAAIGTHPMSEALAQSLAAACSVPIDPAPSPRTSSIAVPAATVCFPIPPVWHPASGKPAPQRICAEQVFHGLVAFAEHHATTLHADGATRRRPQKDRTDDNASPNDDFSAERIRRAARSLWPEGNLPIQRVPWFCDLYRSTAISNRTIVYFDPKPVVEGDAVTLEGASSVPELCRSIETALRNVGVEQIRNRMRSLPDEDRLGGRLFGACTAPTALTTARPAATATAQTQLLYGEPLFLLDREEGCLLVHAGDGYWGWVREDAVRLMTRDEFREYTRLRRAAIVRDVDFPGGRLYRGAQLPLQADGDERVTLRSPDGRAIEAPADAVRVTDDTAAARRRVAAAVELLYVPYVFGGRSPIGLDCSGLVGNLDARAGLAPARDAAQQLPGGRLVATRWYRDDIRPGDQVFFIDAVGKVFHTGIAISPTHFIHSSPPAVQINSLRRGDRLYAEHWDRTFLAATRP